MSKYIPQVGEPLYTCKYTGYYYVDYCKEPYTVIGLKRNKTGDVTRVIAQACRLVFYGPRYFDTLPDEIVPDMYGKILEFRWSEKSGMWIETPANFGTRNANYAIFGEYKYQPYLD